MEAQLAASLKVSRRLEEEAAAIRQILGERERANRLVQAEVRASQKSVDAALEQQHIKGQLMRNSTGWIMPLRNEHQCSGSGLTEQAVMTQHSLNSAFMALMNNNKP